MFWSGNYIAVRELNFLLKEENVTLTQVLEADDILQECKADNKALMQFLTKPKILAELITLITEEPPKNVELSAQYRHASIACEVLTSHLSSLSDQLSADAAQMHRLCDFIDREPPLNPLLASYFSKTVEMLLERSRNHDWYLYHVGCLRVLDFFKSRRDFLPNLLRHICTSAIADTFKYFIRLGDLFNKIIMEWFEEHQLLECLIQIVCGTYTPEPLGAARASAAPDAGAEAEAERPEKGQVEPSEKQPPAADPPADTGPSGADGEAEAAAAERARRLAAVASANAAALLCDLIHTGCAGDGCMMQLNRSRTSVALAARLGGAGGVRLVLQGVFTAPGAARAHALVNGALVLRALLDQDPILGGECESERTSVELAVAPHLPLLHQALLERAEGPEGAGGGVPGGAGRVGLPRVQVAALLAHLALSEVEEVATTMLTLGTPGVVVDMLFAHAHNNFLHAQAHALVKHALANKVYRTQYARHLLIECDLVTRLMDVFEENENKESGSPRSAYMGHVVLMLRRVAAALDEGVAQLPAAVSQRWDAFRQERLAPLLHRHDTPLGGYYPSENIYEFTDVTAAASLDDMPSDIGADAYYEIRNANDPSDFLSNEVDLEDGDKGEGAKNDFLELARQRFDDDMWEDSPEADEGEAEDGEDAEDAPSLSHVRELLDQHSPWESSGGGGSSSGAGEAGGAGCDAGEASEAGWAQFESFGVAGAADPFAPAAPAAPAADDGFSAFWPYADAEATESSSQELEAGVGAMSLSGGGKLDDASSVELANKLLSAMSGMAPDVLAGIVGGVPYAHQDGQIEQQPLGESNDIQNASGRSADNESPAPDAGARSDVTSHVTPDVTPDVTADVTADVTDTKSEAAPEPTASSEQNTQQATSEECPPPAS